MSTSLSIRDKRCTRVSSPPTFRSFLHFFAPQAGANRKSFGLWNFWCKSGSLANNMAGITDLSQSLRLKIFREFWPWSFGNSSTALPVSYPTDPLPPPSTLDFILLPICRACCWEWNKIGCFPDRESLLSSVVYHFVGIDIDICCIHDLLYILLKLHVPQC